MEEGDKTVTACQLMAQRDAWHLSDWWGLGIIVWVYDRGSTEKDVMHLSCFFI